MGSDQDYKDKVRHGGKRRILLEKFGSVCAMCGQEFEECKIAAHHLRDKLDHEFQILLCLSCHAKLHGGTDRKSVSPEELQEAINSSSTLAEVQRKFGLSKHGLWYKREKYGLLEKSCPECKKIYKPRQGFHQYCSRECANKVAKRKLIEGRIKNRGRKKEQCRLDYQKHREERIAKSKEYYQRNRDKILEYHKKLYEYSKV